MPQEKPSLTLADVLDGPSFDSGVIDNRGSAARLGVEVTVVVPPDREDEIRQIAAEMMCKE